MTTTKKENNLYSDLEFLINVLKMVAIIFFIIVFLFIFVESIRFYIYIINNSFSIKGDVFWSVVLWLVLKETVNVLTISINSVVGKNKYGVKHFN